jgi:hypothetical protein
MLLQLKAYIWPVINSTSASVSSPFSWPAQVDPDELRSESPYVKQANFYARARCGDGICTPREFQQAPHGAVEATCSADCYLGLEKAGCPISPHVRGSPSRWPLYRTLQVEGITVGRSANNTFSVPLAAVAPGADAPTAPECGANGLCSNSSATCLCKSGYSGAALYAC